MKLLIHLVVCGSLTLAAVAAPAALPPADVVAIPLDTAGAEAKGHDRQLRERLGHATLDLVGAIADAERRTAGIAVATRYETVSEGLEIEVVLLVEDGRQALRYDAVDGRLLEGPPEEPSAAQRIRSRTGLTFAVLESKIRRRIVSTDTPYGFRIRRVEPDSPAARAGLEKGDVLLTFDGRPVRTLAELRGWLSSTPAEAEIPITYARLRTRRSILTRRPWRTHDGVLSPATDADPDP